MKRPHQVCGTMIVALSTWMALESLRLKFYTSIGPGPGFFPFWISVLVGAMGAAMAYQATFGRSDPMPADFYPSRVGFMRMVSILGALVWTVVMMNLLGFRLTMLVFFLFLLFVLGRVNPLIAICIAVFGSFGGYYLFDQWLLVPLPMGLFGI